jgi:hypothetical protein
MKIVRMAPPRHEGVTTHMLTIRGCDYNHARRITNKEFLPLW